MEMRAKSKGDDADRSPQSAGAWRDDAQPCRSRKPHADLECQTLVAEQARELAHRLRSPLGAIDLVCESLVLEQPDSEIAERLQVILRASAKLKQALDETVSTAAPRWPARQSMDLVAACARLAEADGLDYAPDGQAPVWIAAAPPDGELALSQALSLARLGSRDGEVRLDLTTFGATTPETTQGVAPGARAPGMRPSEPTAAQAGTPPASGAELSLTPKKPLGPLDQRLDGDVPTQSLAFLRLKRLRRFAAEQGGGLQVEPSRLLLRLRTLSQSTNRR